MAINVMQDVWEHAPVTAGDLLVALALADSANSDSRECWPSIGRLMTYCRLSDRQVQRVLLRLERRRVITRVIRPGHSSLYRVNTPDMYVGTTKCHPDTSVTPTPDMGVTPPPTPTSPRTVREPSVEPSGTRRPRSRPPRHEMTLAPEDWTEISDEDAAFIGGKLHLSDPRAIYDVFDSFLAWHRAHGTRMVDWRRGLQAWVLKERRIMRDRRLHATHRG